MTLALTLDPKTNFLIVYRYRHHTKKHTKLVQNLDLHLQSSNESGRFAQHSLPPSSSGSGKVLGARFGTGSLAIDESSLMLVPVRGPAGSFNGGC